MITAFTIALAIVSMAIVGVTWSRLFPDRGIWPPREPSKTFKLVVWILILLFFGCAAFLGIADWNGLNWPTLLRWGIGLPLIVVGSMVAWRGIVEIGLAATSGDRDRLITDGLYAKYRNPQYLAEIAILSGWLVLCASEWVFLPVIGAIGVLILSPFYEELWLEEAYGHRYRAYKSATRRFL